MSDWDCPQRNPTSSLVGGSQNTVIESHHSSIDSVVVGSTPVSDVYSDACSSLGVDSDGRMKVRRQATQVGAQMMSATSNLDVATDAHSLHTVTLSRQEGTLPYVGGNMCSSTYVTAARIATNLCLERVLIATETDGVYVNDEQVDRMSAEELRGAVRDETVKPSFSEEFVDEIERTVLSSEAQDVVVFDGSNISNVKDALSENPIGTVIHSEQ